MSVDPIKRHASHILENVQSLIKELYQIKEPCIVIETKEYSLIFDPISIGPSVDDEFLFLVEGEDRTEEDEVLSSRSMKSKSSEWSASCITVVGSFQ